MKQREQTQHQQQQEDSIKSDAMLPITLHPKRARCVLSVPNHSMHCYPVGTQVGQNEESNSLDGTDRKGHGSSGGGSSSSATREETFTDSYYSTSAPPKFRTRFMAELPRRKTSTTTTSVFSKRRLIPWIYYIAIAMLTFLSLRQMPLIRRADLVDWVPFSSPVFEQYNYREDDTRCIFLISMGKQAAETKIVERFLLSTRRRGRWNGYVILLTDAPTARYKALSDEDKHFLVMHPRPEHFNWNTKHDMPYKRFKTFVLDYIDSEVRLDNVRLVYYLDVDIVVGNSLDAFFRDVEKRYHITNRGDHTSAADRFQRKYERIGTNSTDASVELVSSLVRKMKQPYRSNIYFFKGNFAKTPVQGGQIIMERASSQYCLEWWRRLIDAHVNETKDQFSLRIMLSDVESGKEKRCHLTVMDQEPHLHFPSNESIQEILMQPMNERNHPTLVHIKNTGKVREIPEESETTYIKDLLRIENVDASIGTKMHFDPDGSPVE